MRAADSPPVVPGPAFTVTVRAPRAEGDSPPVAAARVLADMPDGRRVEHTTDAAGVASFATGDGAHGPMDITVVTPDHTLLSLIDRDPAAGAFEVALNTNSSDRPSVTLGGAVLNRASPAAQMQFSTPGVGFEVWYANGDSYAIRVVAGVPFAIFGIEPGAITYANATDWSGPSARFARLQMPALTTRTVADFDWTADPLPTRTARVTAYAPSTSRALRGGGYFEVRVGQLSPEAVLPSLSIGLSATGLMVGQTLRPDGGWDIDVRHAPDVETSDLGWIVDVSTPGVGSIGYGEWSTRRCGGGIPASVVVNDMLAPPVGSATTLVPRAVLELATPPADVIPRIQIERSNGYIWVIEASPGAATLHIPLPPSGLAPDLEVAAMQLRGRISYVDPAERAGCRRQSWSQFLSVDFR